MNCNYINMVSIKIPIAELYPAKTLMKDTNILFACPQCCLVRGFQNCYEKNLT